MITLILSGCDDNSEKNNGLKIMMEYGEVVGVSADNGGNAWLEAPYD